MFKGFTVKRKLIFGFGTIITVMLFYGLLSIFGLVKNLKNLEDEKLRIEKILLTQRINIDVQKILLKVSKIIVVKDPEIKNEIALLRTDYKEAFDKLKKITKKQEGLKLIDDLAILMKETAPYNDMVIKNATEGNDTNTAMSVYVVEVEPRLSKINKALTDLVQYQQKRVNEEINQKKQNSNIMLIMTTIAIAIVLLFSLIISFSIYNSISKPIANLNYNLQKIANGDLVMTIDTSRQDEIGEIARNLDTAINAIKTLISHAKNASFNLSSSAEELSRTTEEINKSIKNQTERASQIATSAEEMTQTITDIAKNASNIAEVSTNSAGTAKEGKNKALKTLEEIKKIKLASEKLGMIITNLGERSAHIGEIIVVIKDIADQTNLLALNAAIEAARAGEQGRGFAVVADEVRKLAERTGKATDEISQMIQNIQKDIEIAIQSMDETAKRVEDGVIDSQDTSASIDMIVKKTEEVREMIQQIATATEEMSSTTETISQDITNIVEGLKGNSLATEQADQIASNVSSMGHDLLTSIGKFNI